eukprot:scaffold81693_cov21-Tisochrysis_lutea.AAC.1
MSHCLRRLDELTLEQRERVLAHLLERLHMQAAATTAGQIAPNNTSGKIGMAQEESNLYAAIMISLRATPLCWQGSPSFKHAHLLSLYLALQNLGTQSPPPPAVVSCCPFPQLICTKTRIYTPLNSRLLLPR